MPRKKHFSEKLETRVKAAEKAQSRPAVERGKDKAADFIRLAEPRHFKVCEGLRLIGNLSDVNNYSYTKEQVDMLLDSVQEELNATRARFKAESHKQRRGRIKLAA
jgi:hypothetical protein